MLIDAKLIRFTILNLNRKNRKTSKNKCFIGWLSRLISLGQPRQIQYTFEFMLVQLILAAGNQFIMSKTLFTSDKLTKRVYCNLQMN